MRNGDVSTLLSICGHASNLRLSASLHATILKTTGGGVHRNSLLNNNSLISMYSRCNDLASASKLFTEMTHKDAVTYNSMLSAIFRNTQAFSAGIHFYKCIPHVNSGPAALFYDHATFTTILSESESACDVEVMHSVVLGRGYQVEVSVGNALLTAYFRCELSGSARKVFVEMDVKNVITWTAMVSGLRRVELYDESFWVFREMRKCAVAANPLTFSSALMACGGARAVGEGRQIHGIVLKHGVHRELHVESTLMDMYSKCGAVDDACRVFESIEDPDKISQTVILIGLAQNNLEEKAVDLFVKMVNNTPTRIEIDADIVSGVLGAFRDHAPFSLGKQIHSLATKKGFDSNVFVSNGLINMYSKSGDVQSSFKIFTGMTHRNAVTWTSIISASARHGLAHEALRLYETMRSPSQPDPTDTTFLSLLHACSHVGAVEKGMEYLKSMSEDHNLEPRAEHYACVVDMLGRAARLEEAKLFIESLPVRPNALIWQALLGACGIHGDLRLGKYAAERLQVLAPECPAGYVLLANICSFRGEWRERGRVIKKMRDVGVKKDVGMSWIEIAGYVHRFIVGDETHWKIDAVYQALLQLMMHCRDDNEDDEDCAMV